MEVLPDEERIKRELHPLDAFARLVAAANNDRPPSAGDAFRFQWFGVFYEGPRRDACTLRVRLPGGRLSAAQLVALSGIIQELAAGHILCPLKGALEIPSIALRDVPDALRRLDEIGLRTALTGGDCVQAVSGGELDGLPGWSDAAAIDPLVRELDHIVTVQRELADLPAPCTIGIRARHEPAFEPKSTLVFHETADESFQLRVANSDFVAGVERARLIASAVELLLHWSRRVDRSERGRASLPAFCQSTGSDELRRALSLTAPAPVRPFAIAPLPDGFPVTGGRLLSRDLIRLADRIIGSGSDELRVRGGAIYFHR